VGDHRSLEYLLVEWGLEDPLVERELEDPLVAGPDQGEEPMARLDPGTEQAQQPGEPEE
jgi:hypothetical protein